MLFNVPLAIIMTILLPIMGVIIWVFQKFSRKAFRQVRRSVAASNASIKELLNYIVIVKSYGGEKDIEERYNTVNKGLLEAGLFEVTTFSIFRPLVDGLFFVALNRYFYYYKCNRFGGRCWYCFCFHPIHGSILPTIKRNC